MNNVLSIKYLVLTHRSLIFSTFCSVFQDSLSTPINYKSVLLPRGKNISYVRLNKPYIRLIISYVQLIISSVRRIISSVRDNKSHIDLSSIYFASIMAHRVVNYVKSEADNPSVILLMVTTAK